MDVTGSNAGSGTMVDAGGGVDCSSGWAASAGSAIFGAAQAAARLIGLSAA
jgi:hypothetical protein